MAEAGGAKRNAKTRKTAPFASFWYCHFPPAIEKSVVKKWDGAGGYRLVALEKSPGAKNPQGFTLV